MTATLSTITPNSDGTITVAGTGAGGTVTLQRANNGGPWATVDAATISGASWTYTDRFAAVAGVVTYRASDDGGTTWTASTDTDVATGGWWLRDLTSTGMSIQVTPSAGDPVYTWDHEYGEFWPLGATTATVYKSSARLVKVELPALMLWGPGDRRALINLLNRAQVQLATDTGDTYWLSCSKPPVVTEPNGSTRSIDGGRLMLAAVELVPVSTPSGGH